MRYIFFTLILIQLCSCLSLDRVDDNSVVPFSGEMLSIHPDSMPVVDTIDFGRIRRGEVVVHTVRVQNASNDKPLVLLSHDSSCGCTSIEYDKKPIAPKQYKDVKFIFNSNAADGGKQLKLVKIHTSFVDQPCRFYVMAQVD